MDKGIIGPISRQLFAENIYRGILTIWATSAGFSALPDHKALIASSVLFLSAGFRGVMIYSELVTLKVTRAAVVTSMATRFANIDLHNRALRGEPVEDDLESVWHAADQKALSELADYGRTLHWGIGAFLLQLATDAVCVGIASLISP